MIKTRKELNFYIAADRIMNGKSPKKNVKDILFDRFIIGGIILEYLYAMRKVAYYSNVGKNKNILHHIKYLYWAYRFQKLSLKLGFTIGYNVLGYGVVIPHPGTIVLGLSNRIGNFAVLNTCTCLQDNGKIIGDGFYLATGVKMTKKVVLGNNVSVGANSLVNKEIHGDNIMIAGSPAKFIKESPAWYVRDGETYYNRVQQVKELYASMFLKQ